MKDFLVRLRGADSALIVKAVNMPALFQALQRQLGVSILKEVVQVTDGEWHHNNSFERKESDGSRKV